MSSEVELLARWSLGVQLGTATLLAAFFIALMRTIRLQEIRIWAAAWIADTAAISSAFLATALSPPLAVRAALSAYVGFKTAYVLLLVTGARNHFRPGGVQTLRLRWIVAAVGAWSLALGLLAPTREFLQFGMSLMAGGFLTSGAVWVLRRRRVPRSRWLGTALLAEGVLFLLYVPVLLPTVWGGTALARQTQYAPFLDAGAELFMALAILVVIEGSSSQHLEHLNRELLVSQESLRQLVDLDPLTALANRRRLRDEMERVRAAGAAVIFLDVDNFKDINDRFGHIAGDACLLRVAAALRRTFRSDDTLFRFGGDEFLVIAPGLDPEAAGTRVEKLRADLALGEEGTPPCRISVGIASLAPRGEPEAALREADDRMYLEKRRRKVEDHPRGAAYSAVV
ncbi:MAG TPA: GGDEF domain-containing protein [Thermoanaerobaculaceae bacterium]|nr:GGDEF domain-containing protein [Thermoanaerobaculaceae bacterium]HQU32937.1 GGDEF domain-containing protein [Thermoanaerobaculaceae bacterium]